MNRLVVILPEDAGRMTGQGIGPLVLYLGAV